MKDIEENISKIKKESKNLLILLVIFLSAIGLYLYNTKYYVIIRFDELGPITKNMSAYYNGFKIGKIVRIRPDKDFKHTLARVDLTFKDLNLPQNTTVKVESFPNGELYLQFMYPQSPSLRALKRGDILEGLAKYNIEEFMLGQNISGVSDIVSIHVIRALNATEIANQEMQVFFKNTSKLVEENSKAIKMSVNNMATTTKNLARMAENLNQISGKLNNSLDEKSLKATASNVELITSNVKDTTTAIREATKDIDKTVKKIDDTIYQVNTTAENLNSMTGGLNETLSKRFAGMRIIFGSPVKQKNKVRNACN